MINFSSRSYRCALYICICFFYVKIIKPKMLFVWRNAHIFGTWVIVLCSYIFMLGLFIQTYIKLNITTILNHLLWWVIFVSFVIRFILCLCLFIGKSGFSYMDRFQLWIEDWFRGISDCLFVFFLLSNSVFQVFEAHTQIAPDLLYYIPPCFAFCFLLE